MKKLLLLGIAAVLFLSLQSCYVVLEPGSDGYYGGDSGNEPPPVLFEAPPDVIVMPDTNDVYVVPDIAVDLFFWDGWWWRLWDGRWYRSPYYNRGWGYYNNVPGFYADVNPGWRGYYREHNWRGHRWNYERIPHQRLQQNWKRWHTDRHWEKEKNWGVERHQPQPQRQDQIRQPKVDPPKQQYQGTVKQPQRQDQIRKPRVDPPKQQ